MHRLLQILGVGTALDICDASIREGERLCVCVSNDAVIIDDVDEMSPYEFNLSGECGLPDRECDSR